MEKDPHGMHGGSMEGHLGGSSGLAFHRHRREDPQGTASLSDKVLALVTESGMSVSAAKGFFEHMKHQVEISPYINGPACTSSIPDQGDGPGKGSRGAPGGRYAPFIDGNIERPTRDGERCISGGFVKTYGFEEVVAFTMLMTEQLWGLMQEHKDLHMELDYDEGALNTEYRFYTRQPPDTEQKGCSRDQGSGAEGE